MDSRRPILEAQAVSARWGDRESPAMPEERVMHPLARGEHRHGATVLRWVAWKA